MLKHKGKQKTRYSVIVLAGRRVLATLPPVSLWKLKAVIRSIGVEIQRVRSRARRRNRR